MYLVHFFDQYDYAFAMSLHSDLAAAEAACESMLRHFNVNKSVPGEENWKKLLPGTLPSKEHWHELFDDAGEGVHLYRIARDGGPAEQLEIGASAKEQVA